MPSDELVEKAVTAISKRTADYQYFFDNLKSATWIEPLAAKGLFTEPLPAQREGDYVRFPFWPESRYLARVAGEAPAQVLKVALQMPETDNVRVFEDLTDAAIAMPPELAVRLVPKAIEWAKNPFQLLLPDKLASLAAHLAQGGEVDAALRLAAVLLEVLEDSRVEADKEDEDEEFWSVPEPRARFEEWVYERVLDEVRVGLLSTARTRTLELLIGLLSKAISLSGRKEADAAADYSYVWRPAIEEHDQNMRHGIKDVLVSGVRDAAVALASGNEETAREVIRLLESQLYVTFKRIAFHVMRVVPEVPGDLIQERLRDPLFMDDSPTHHEFWLLARDRLDVLDDEDRTAFLEAIDRGPDRRGLRDGLQRWRGETVSDEDVERYVASWKSRRFAILREVLPPKYRNKLGQLATESASPEHPEFLTYMEEGRGGSSPIGNDQLKGFSVDELLDFLRTWQPSGDWMSASRDGLGHQLSAVVAEDPEPYAEHAERFIGMDPNYVRGLIWGLEQAHKAKKPFTWKPVLELCRWVVGQRREIPGYEGEYRDLDPGWVWTRKSIASLLSTGFDKSENPIPIEFRETVWAILVLITEDPDPTVEDEARYGGDNMDPSTLAINTTRGEAMHAVVRYALWLQRKFESSPKARTDVGWERFPEVREVLDRHLDPSYDPSPSIRSVYGQWFPWLILLDRAWAETNVSKVFPIENELSRLRDAAWDTYVVFCQPYDSAFEVLHSEYQRAVDRLEARTPDNRRFDPDRHLAQHVMTYYWQGKIPLEPGSDNLLGRFYAKASPQLRATALEFIGRAMWNSPADVLDRIVERLKRLWAWRFDVAAKASNVDDYRKELAAFGWWFASARFDDAWAISGLKSTLQLAGEIEADHLVAQRLVSIAEPEPREAMRCMKLLAETDKEGWGVIGWRDSARTAISIALESDDGGARTEAEDLVHYLGARGHLEFRDLLRGK